MSNTKSADLILERWIASLKNKDRSKKAVGNNFDELFEELKKDGTDFQTAHTLLPKAIKAHQPSIAMARKFYKNLKSKVEIDKSENEFIAEWNESIAQEATNSFYSFFEFKDKDEEDDAPKLHGNMSAKEYRLQRKYAESFPILDTAALEKRLRDSMYNPSEQDILNVLGDKDDGEAN